MSKLAAASLAIDARLSSMQDAIKVVLSAVDNVAPWDTTLAAIDALRPFVDADSPLADRPLNIIPPSLVIDPAPNTLRIVPAAACHLCNPTEVCGLCKASLDAPRPTRESERAMKRQAEEAVAWGDAARAGSIDLSPQKVAAASRAIGLPDAVQTIDPRVSAAIDRAGYACDVCGKVPDEDGMIEHGRGCYTVSSDGGGQSFVDMPRPQMAEACAVEVEAFDRPSTIPHHLPADPTDAYTMDGSKFCAFCGLPSHGSRLCCGCAAEQSGLS